MQLRDRRAPLQALYLNRHFVFLVCPLARATSCNVEVLRLTREHSPRQISARVASYTRFGTEYFNDAGQAD